MVHFNGKILSNTSVCPHTHQIVFEWDKSAHVPAPGQFITIRVSESSVPLLRRPFAISAFDPDSYCASIIYLDRGVSTAILAGKNTGDVLDVIGPLGNGFAFEPLPDKAFVCAGGIGVGPMLFLAAELAKKGVDAQFLYGCRNKELVLDSQLFSSFEAAICTDDGSLGHKGTPVDFLRQLDYTEVEKTILYCCGPQPMLHACHQFAIERDIPCIVSMEQVMACGVGACMGCVVKTNHAQGYARVCKEGPVFDSREIIWT